MGLTKDWPHGYEVVFRDGVVPAEVICWGKPGPNPVVAYSKSALGSYPHGSIFIADSDGRGFGFVELRNAPAPKRSGTVWLAVHQTYRDGPIHFVAHDAEGFPKPSALAVKRIDWTEGDGL